MDGTDLAYCHFQKQNGWKYSIIHAETVVYPSALKEKLTNPGKLSGEDLIRLDHELGRHFGSLCRRFIQENRLEPDFISSHGHTLFHRPDESYSLQIGNGFEISAATGLPVVYDFRSADVALGGQGAPLVPVGDKFLFGEYDACLNLGGFSNITLLGGDHLRAWDICPVNTLLNDLAGQLELDYDTGGELGRSGRVVEELVNSLNDIDYYSLSPPKSLGREYLDGSFYPVMEKFSTEVRDRMASCYEHIGFQIGKTLEENQVGKVLVTGGGAKNAFLMEKIAKNTRAEITKGDAVLIDYKEALIFGFLGLLRILEETNGFSSVTGATSNSCGGALVNVKGFGN